MEQRDDCKLLLVQLLENTPLVKFIRNYMRDLSGVFFHILISEDIDDVISHFFTVVCATSQFVCIRKRILHGDL